MLPTGCINGSPHCNGKMGTNIAEQSAAKFSGVMDEQGSTFRFRPCTQGTTEAMKRRERAPQVGPPRHRAGGDEGNPAYGVRL
jgi:hypothetical protein